MLFGERRNRSTSARAFGLMRRCPALMVVLSLAALSGQTGTYRAVSIDNIGQLHITSTDGKNFVAPKLPGQTAFSGAAISGDRQSVGWLAEAVISSSGTSLLPVAVVIFRNGRITRKFLEPYQIVWGWRFEENGKRVAYSVGPTHGGAHECILAETYSGKVIERWHVTPDTAAPGWAESLRR